MINLRYHIVSLTAVFLALGIGVLLGGTYLDKYTVDQLDQSITNAEARIRETRAENNRLRGELGDAEARNQALIGGGTVSLFQDNLVDVPVLVIASEGADETSRRNLLQCLAASGADFRGALTLTGRLALDDAQVAELGQRLGISSPTAQEVKAELVQSFADALTEAGVEGGEPTVPDGTSTSTTSVPGDGPTTTVANTPTTSTTPTTADQGTPAVTVTTEPTEPVEPPTQPEVITTMVETGLLSLELPPGEQPTTPLLSDTGYRYVFLSGPAPAVADSEFMIPVLGRMAETGRVPAILVSAAVDGSEREAVVSAVREDSDLSRLISTVDNLEVFNGLLSTLLGLDEIGRGARGHYGEGRGAAAPIPSGT